MSEVHGPGILAKLMNSGFSEKRPWLKRYRQSVAEEIADGDLSTFGLCT